VYRNYKDSGVSLLFEEKDKKLVVDSVFVYNEGVDGYHRYTGKLPCDLTFNMTNADVVHCLGEPEGKPPKGNVVTMFIDYRKLGLQIDFTSKTYEDRKNPITCVCIYPVT